MMERKQFLTMIIAMIFLLVFFLYFFGWFSTDKEEIDTIAESTNWKLLSNSEEPSNLYFIYKGNDTLDENIHIQGVQFYNVSENSKDVEKEETINKELIMTHHIITGVPLGEYRWYINNIDLDSINLEQSLKSICARITWKINSESFSEYIISENLSANQISQIKKSIE